MITLEKTGAYLVNGTEIIPDNHEAAAAIAAKTGRQITKEEAAKEIEKLAEFEGAYYKHIKPYIDILLKGANVVIVPLKSVKEVYFEGKMMHHCVYECKYWQKKDTLLLSAQVDGKHVETIEFNLKELKVMQSRGLQNKPSQYHEEILSLIQQGKKEIKSLMRKAA